MRGREEEEEEEEDEEGEGGKGGAGSTSGNGHRSSGSSTRVRQAEERSHGSRGLAPLTCFFWIRYIDSFSWSPPHNLLITRRVIV